MPNSNENKGFANSDSSLSFLKHFVNRIKTKEEDTIDLSLGCEY